MKREIRGRRDSSPQCRNKRKHIPATWSVLAEECLQSVFKYFAMATGAVIRAKQAKLLLRLGLR